MCIGLRLSLRRSGHRPSSTWQTTRCCLRACYSSLPWSPLEQTLARRYEFIAMHTMLQYVLHTAHEPRMAWKHANSTYFMGSALFVLGNAAVGSTSCILHQRQDMCSTGAQYFCWPLKAYVLNLNETCGSWPNSSSIRWSNSSRHNKSTALEEVGTICMLPGQACTRWLAPYVKAGLRRSRCIVQCTRLLLNGISCSCQTNFDRILSNNTLVAWFLTPDIAWLWLLYMALLLQL